MQIPGTLIVKFRKSQFKDKKRDHEWFNNWVNKMESLNGKSYTRLHIITELGETQVWALPGSHAGRESLVIFPGARTSSLFWDLDNNLETISNHLNIYLVETNGLPNLSDGNTPDIKSKGYGSWAAEVLDKLDIDQAWVAGASFGGLVALKLCLVSPLKVKGVFLFNPGCLQPFSVGLKNLFYNLLPILLPSRRNVNLFLNKAILHKPEHMLSASNQKLIADYEIFALTRYQDKTQKPYDMNSELIDITNPIHLLLGEKDILFPYELSATNAEKKFKDLKSLKTFPNVGHGIETYKKAIDYMGDLIAQAQ